MVLAVTVSVVEVSVEDNDPENTPVSPVPLGGGFLAACSSPLLKIRRPEGVEGESVQWGLRPP